MFVDCKEGSRLVLPHFLFAAHTHTHKHCQCLIHTNALEHFYNSNLSISKGSHCYLVIVGSWHAFMNSPSDLICLDEVDDDRLAIVKELMRSEDTYLENLRNIFDIYMEPLK